MKGGFVILGAPGAGKGTQAERVCARLGLAHLATGDLLRAAAAAGTPAGRSAKRLMDAGALVPDATVLSVLFDKLAESDEGFLLDGFPRNRAQAEGLDRRLEEEGRALTRVVEIAVPDERILARLVGRRFCPQCGRSFHVTFLPPAKNGMCDGCGAHLQQRPDDAPETVARRLAVYREQTAPLVDYYDARGLLVRVDGNRDVELVTNDLLEALTEGAMGSL